MTGFIKAANISGLPEDEILGLIKKAYTDDLSDEDIARIRIALREAGVPPGYNDPTGQTSAQYNQAILNTRNSTLGENPQQQGISAGLGKAVGGAFVGGAAGHLAGSALKGPGRSAILNALRSRLPKGLGLAGAIGGGLLAGVPAYEAKQKTVTNFQKLNDPRNVERLSSALQADKYLLNS